MTCVLFLSYSKLDDQNKACLLNSEKQRSADVATRKSCLTIDQTILHPLNLWFFEIASLSLNPSYLDIFCFF